MALAGKDDGEKDRGALAGIGDADEEEIILLAAHLARFGIKAFQTRVARAVRIPAATSASWASSHPCSVAYDPLPLCHTVS